MPSITYWYTHLFGRLGWVMLAKEQGKTYRVTAYKQSINSLLKTIDHVAAEYEEHNRKHDLNVMKMHVVALQNYVKKHL
jgi:hypothetical protein